MMAVSVPQATAQQATNASLSQAEQLIHAGRLAEARDVLVANPPVTAAEHIRWNWAMAILLRRSGAPREATVHLERLVSMAPGQKRFRLELGAALAAAGQDERARYQFDLARGDGLTAQEEAGVARTLNKLADRKSWERFFRFAVVPETNAEKRTAARTVIVGGFRIDLNPSVRTQDATSVQLGFGAFWLPKLGDNLRGRVGFSTDAKLYGGTATDDVTVRVELGFVIAGDRQRSIGAGLTFGQRWLDGQVYSSAPGIAFSYQTLVGQRGRMTAQASAGWLGHDALPGLDGPRYVADIQYSHAVTPQLVLRAGAKVARTDARLATERETATELRLGASYAFEGGLIMGLDLAQEHSSRDATSFLFGKRRKDRLGSVTLRVLHRDIQWRGFAPVIEVGYEQRQSNIGLFDYENMRGPLGFTRQF